MGGRSTALRVAFQADSLSEVIFFFFLGSTDKKLFNRISTSEIRYKYQFSTKVKNTIEKMMSKKSEDRPTSFQVIFLLKKVIKSRFLSKRKKIESVQNKLQKIINNPMKKNLLKAKELKKRCREISPPRKELVLDIMRSF